MKLRSAAALAATLLFVPFTATSASAAVPANDTFAGATVVGSLPTTIEQDTTEATTDALDASLNGMCGAPATNASVWFTYTDITGDGFLADVSASDYTAGVIVTAGDPNEGNLVACGPGQVGVRGEAGTTYSVMAFSDSAAQGGNLSMTFGELPPAPTAALTVDPRGVAYKDGTARITGTYNCTNADGFNSDVSGTLTQTVGRVKINGFFFVNPLECDGSTHTWEAFVFSENGLFSGGKAANFSVAFACGLAECAVVEASGKVQLSRNGK
ncbi:hypothetical protein N802_13110 [Knoellia sinensis KCTC 19936]|uniref:DUF6299 domain-containing protein n=1 Tax=Knoellia sinensis KCTC 19936 TaxID=1385520 RepID=A0A0A0JEE4_9MICO|nr:DUF6299 family protein [Knoellia sinensis]KGN34427.1 hypothetical protein N802_13110 [Knoellia sinensis KCTC 19936]